MFTSNARHTKQSDVYSLGIVFWELATRKQIHDEYDDEVVILAQVKIGERPIIPSEIPEKYKQIIQNAWKHNPQQRPTCFQLMEDLYNEMDRIHKLTVSNNDSYAIDLHPEGAPSELNDPIRLYKKYRVRFFP